MESQQLCVGFHVLKQTHKGITAFTPISTSQTPPLPTEPDLLPNDFLSYLKSNYIWLVRCTRVYSLPGFLEIALYPLSHLNTPTLLPWRWARVSHYV